jgi:hypothetical protein
VILPPLVFPAGTHPQLLDDISDQELTTRLVCQSICQNVPEQPNLEMSSEV